MIKSMTGYGKAIAETPQKKITIEIKSLNSKQLDITTKIPWIYKEKEPEIRNIISRKLERGKIDFAIYFDILDDTGSTLINKSVVISYYNQFKDISEELNLTINDQILPVIMKLPEALKTVKPDLPEEECILLMDKIEESLCMLDNYRIQEGLSIEKDIRKCLSKIIDSLSAVEDFEAGRIEKVKDKLQLLLRENIGNDNVDMNRFEQEIIYYLEKFDINEEKVRLKRHCEYFLESINSPSPNGRILSFIAQEIGREVNTIGSKANDSSIQKLVVMMKDELEKIKEQTMNIL